MMVVRFSGTVDPAAQRATFRCAVVLLLGLTLCFLRPLAAATPAAVTDREAQIAVMADMSANGPDQLNIRILNSTDQDELRAIAAGIGDKLHAEPTGLSFTTGDPNYITDHSVGLDFLLPVVPRGEGYLPLAPIIEAFAPHVGKIRLLYIIRGSFTYQGYQEYRNRDFAVTVDPPEKTPLASGTPLAFYGVNAIIKNPSLKSAPMPRYPREEGFISRASRMSPWWWILLAGVLGAGMGLVLAKLLPRRQR